MKKYFLFSFLLLSSIAIVNGCKDLSDAIAENPLTDNSIVATINSASFSALGTAFKRDEGNNTVSVNAVITAQNGDSKSLQLTMTAPTALGAVQNRSMRYIVRVNGVDKEYAYDSGTITMTQLTPNFKGTFSGQVKNGNETLPIADGEFNVSN